MNWNPSQRLGPAGSRRGFPGFSLLELLVTLAIILLLAMLLLAVIGRAQSRARRAVCLNNLRQISFAVRMYSDDAQDRAPKPARAVSHPYDAYKELIMDYAGLHGQTSPRAKLFACPADTFYFDYVFGHYPKFDPLVGYVGESLNSRPDCDYASYVFNAGNTFTGSQNHSIHRPGIAGLALTFIKHPSRTALIMDAPALMPFSWHQPKRPLYLLSTRYCPNLIFNNALNAMSFVDGHARLEKIYWNGTFGPYGVAANYDPPAKYEYQWSPN